jgi:allophanate hydrolase subunit 2
VSGLRVVHPGAFTTLQDLGRRGYRDLGVPTGGAFDVASFRLANALAGNPPDRAALELTLLGGTYEALGPLVVALAGAAMDARVEPPAGPARHVRVPAAIPLGAGDRLVVGGTSTGARLYLAAHGGFEAGPELGSRSRETPLIRDAILPAGPASGRTLWPDPALVARPQGPLRVVAGPDDGPRPGGAVRVGTLADRMGLRLESDTTPAGPVPDPDRLSAPVAPGAIQWTGSGWIVLGVAAGTMGGYPVVAQVIRADIDRLGQLRPGDPVAFQEVTIAVAIAEARARQADLDRRDSLLRVAALDQTRSLDA